MGKWSYVSISNLGRPLERDNMLKWDLNKIIGPGSIWNHNDTTEKNSACIDAMAIFEKQIKGQQCGCR